MVVRGIRCENCPNETFHYYCLTDPNGNGQETHAKCPICKADIELSLRVRINLKPDQVETTDQELRSETLLWGCNIVLI